MNRLIVLIAIVLRLASGADAEEPNHCVACHEREALPITLGHSFSDWRGSAHGRAGIGCEKCHGGDAKAAAEDAAHRGVLPADNPESTVAPPNLPATCGACHSKELGWYKSTVHAKLLKEKQQGATCFTCHGAMATGYPTSRELSARCGVCHSKPVVAQEALVMVSSLRKQLEETSQAVKEAGAVSPPWLAGANDRLTTLQKEYHGVQLKWHAFRTYEVAKDCRDLLKLAHALDDEAKLVLRHEQR